MTLLIVSFAQRRRNQELPHLWRAGGLSAFRSCSTARRSVSALGGAASDPDVPIQASFISKGRTTGFKRRKLGRTTSWARENQYLHIRINVILLGAYFPFDFLDYPINLSSVPPFDSH
jgi:hypothetical protein